MYVKCKFAKIISKIDHQSVYGGILEEEYVHHEIDTNEILGPNYIKPDEFGNNTYLVWEFSKSEDRYYKLNINYYSVLELLGVIGGLIGALEIILGFFILPFAETKFVIKNASRKEEVELSVGYALKDKNTIKEFEEFSKEFKEAKFKENKCILYMSKFLPPYILSKILSKDQ